MIEVLEDSLLRNFMLLSAIPVVGLSTLPSSIYYIGDNVIGGECRYLTKFTVLIQIFWLALFSAGGLI